MDGEKDWDCDGGDGGFGAFMIALFVLVFGRKMMKNRARGAEKTGGGRTTTGVGCREKNSWLLATLAGMG
jgi:hypothetical protein